MIVAPPSVRYLYPRPHVCVYAPIPAVRSRLSRGECAAVTEHGNHVTYVLTPAAVRTVPSVGDYVVDMGHSVLGRVVRQDVNAFPVREDFVTHISH